ncbi:hypothetical protein [Rhodococcus qingshengii]|uniref:hypothetical protein n=1 Tax=Rhodococcus qingshengii TaxID=334542 RepID=UPI0036013666
MTYDSLQDPVNHPDWYEQEIGEQIDHAYDTQVAATLEQPAEFSKVPSYLTWQCGTAIRSSPCSASCVRCGQIDPTDLKLARIESERTEQL